MFYKGRPIRDARRNFKNIKGWGLGFFGKLRDARRRLGSSLQGFVNGLKILISMG